MMAGTERGRSGHSGEPAKMLRCTRKREKGRGGFAHHAEMV
jgi:hypothetical protein